MPARRKQASTWPLGDYLREQRGRMAVREAARRADISESRWRQVEAGVQKMPTKDGTVEVPVHPRPETVAAMCKAIAADPRTGLELAGHNPDQYAWLLEPVLEKMGDAEWARWFDSLPFEEREAVLSEAQRIHVQAVIRETRRTGG